MGEKEAAARRHIGYFTLMAERVEAHHYASLPHAWFKQLRAEQGNLRAAMEWSLSGRHAPQLGLQLVGALGRFWYMGDAWIEGREWLNIALALADENTPPQVRAMVLTQLGDLEHAMAEYGIAKSHLQEALAIWRAIDDQPRLAWTLFQMAVLHSTITDFPKAEALFDECLVLYRRLNEPWFVALVLMQLASTLMSYDDFKRATPLLDEAMPLFRSQGRTNIVAVALNLQGWGLVQQNDPETAIENFKEALTIGQNEADLQMMGWSLRNLGMAYRLTHQLVEAEQNLRTCLRHYQQISFKSGMVIAFEILGCVVADQGKLEEGVRWLAVADQLRQVIGLPRTASDERLYYTPAYQLTTQALSPQAWHAAWAAASRLSLDEALALAGTT